MKTHNALKIVLELARSAVDCQSIDLGVSACHQRAVSITALGLVAKFIDDDVWRFGDLADYDLWTAIGKAARLRVKSGGEDE